MFLAEKIWKTLIKFETDWLLSTRGTPQYRQQTEETANVAGIIRNRPISHAFPKKCMNMIWLMIFIQKNNQRRMGVRKITTILLCITMSQYGCATSSKDIAASYASPLQFQSYDCDQLSSEAQRIQGRVSQLSGRLDKAATNDKWIMTAGLLLAWPALFALGGTKEQEAEYARLKGEYDAIHQSAVMKKCPGVITPQPATPQTTTVKVEEPVIGAAAEPQK